MTYEALGEAYELHNPTLLCSSYQLSSGMMF